MNSIRPSANCGLAAVPAALILALTPGVVSTPWMAFLLSAGWEGMAGLLVPAVCGGLVLAALGWRFGSLTRARFALAPVPRRGPGHPKD
jgi:hypothetical protein